MLFFDIKFNEDEIKAKVMSQRFGKRNKQFENKEENCSFLQRLGKSVVRKGLEVCLLKLCLLLERQMQS